MLPLPFCISGGMKMKELNLIIRPEKLEKLKGILDSLGCGGMTIFSVMGCGTQRGVIEEESAVHELKGLKTTINLLPKIEVDVVVPDSKVDDIIAEVRDKLSSDHVGDGKIFVRTIDEAIRIRTGERNEKAL